METPNVPVVNFEEFEKLTQKSSNDTLYVVNFWATWCKPCVKELPYFENAALKFNKEPVKIILVSLDFPSEKNRVDEFVLKNKLRNKVMLLNAGNPNNWINKVDTIWSGAIPATIFYKKGKKVLFKEGDVEEEELNLMISNELKK